MNLQYTLQRFALQLKNQPHTLKRVARVFQKIMRTLYDTYFPNLAQVVTYWIFEFLLIIRFPLGETFPQ